MVEDDEDWEKTLVLRVRALCQAYGSSAEFIARKDYSEDHELTKTETARYIEGRNRVIGIAIKLTDEFNRDSALHCVLALCMKAKDVQAAVTVAKAITVEAIQSLIIEQYPEFFVFNESDGRLSIGIGMGPLIGIQSGPL
jgi:hypothetical protein